MGATSWSGLRPAVIALTATLVLAGCGGDGDADEPEATAAPSPSSTVAVPDEVELTETGADLSFGETATVIHEPDQRRGSVLELTVEGATKGTLADFSSFVLPPETRTATPYYADVVVKNLGEGDVGGSPVPVWGVDANNTLLPAPTITTTFARCPSRPLPKAFGAGKTFKTCLVFFAPDKGTLEAVSFRPDQEFDPILWTGDIAEPKAPAKKGKKR